MNNRILAGYLAMEAYGLTGNQVIEFFEKLLWVLLQTGKYTNNSIILDTSLNRIKGCLGSKGNKTTCLRYLKELDKRKLLIYKSSSTGIRIEFQRRQERIRMANVRYTYDFFDFVEEGERAVMVGNQCYSFLIARKLMESLIESDLTTVALALPSRYTKTEIIERLMEAALKKQKEGDKK